MVNSDFNPFCRQWWFISGITQAFRSPKQCSLSRLMLHYLYQKEWRRIDCLWQISWKSFMWKWQILKASGKQDSYAIIQKVIFTKQLEPVSPLHYAVHNCSYLQVHISYHEKVNNVFKWDLRWSSVLENIQVFFSASSKHFPLKIITFLPVHRSLQIFNSKSNLESLCFGKCFLSKKREDWSHLKHHHSETGWKSTQTGQHQSKPFEEKIKQNMQILALQENSVIIKL